MAFNPHTSAVCLPEPGNRWEERPAACVITGWGVTGKPAARPLARPLWGKTTVVLSGTEAVVALV